MSVVASCGMAPMEMNMMLRKLTPKKERAPVVVLAVPPNREPMIKPMTMTCSRMLVLGLR